MNEMITRIHSPSAVAACKSFPPMSADDDAGGVPLSSPASSLSTALSVRDGLRQKLDNAKAALDKIDVKRRDIAFSAHTEGGENKKALDKFNNNRVLKVAEIESIEVAILEASRRVADAERAEELVAGGQRASRAAEIAMDLVAYGRAIDEALLAFSDAANGYRRSVEELNYQLGVSHPSVAQLQAAMNRVLRTVVIFTPARDTVEFLGPTERRSMTAVSDDHAAAIMRAVQLRLPSNGDT